MSVTRSSLGSVPFYGAAAKNINQVESSDLDSEALADSEKLKLHQQEEDLIEQYDLNSVQKKSSKLVPVTLGVAGIAGISLMIFGYGTLGFCAAASAFLLGVKHIYDG